MAQTSILDLPFNVYEQIMSYLSYDDIAKTRLVCSQFNENNKQILNHGYFKMLTNYKTTVNHIESISNVSENSSISSPPYSPITHLSNHSAQGSCSRSTSLSASKSHNSEIEADSVVSQSLQSFKRKSDQNSSENKYYSQRGSKIRKLEEENSKLKQQLNILKKENEELKKSKIHKTSEITFEVFEKKFKNKYKYYTKLEKMTIIPKDLTKENPAFVAEDRTTSYFRPTKRVQDQNWEQLLSAVNANGKYKCTECADYSEKQKHLVRSHIINRHNANVLICSSIKHENVFIASDGKNMKDHLTTHQSEETKPQVLSVDINVLQESGLPCKYNLPKNKR